MSLYDPVLNSGENNFTLALKSEKRAVVLPCPSVHSTGRMVCHYCTVRIKKIPKLKKMKLDRDTISTTTCHIDAHSK